VRRKAASIVINIIKRKGANMCKKCKVEVVNETVVPATSNPAALAWSRWVAFIHAGHRFDCTLAQNTERVYSLELVGDEPSANAELLGELATDQKFLLGLACKSSEYDLIRILKKAGFEDKDFTNYSPR
jgi:hypothetical protein